MRRALWKGAISFGLINIPIELFSAEKRDELDFTLLDKRDLSPVGYKRVNKKTGREVPWDNIIKGYEYDDGKFVLMSDEDLRRANVEATQTIDIQSFVEVAQVPVFYYEQPYYLTPAKGGDKAYALLRETLVASGKMAIAQIVIRTRQHLAALLPQDGMLHLITLRYPTELRAPDELSVPSANARKSGVSPQEVEMARALVEHMSADWAPGQFHDTYRDDVLALVNKKIKSRQTHEVSEPEEAAAAPSGGGKVIDLMALLKSSLQGKGGATAKSKKSQKPQDEGKTVAAKKPAKAKEDGEAKKSAKPRSASVHPLKPAAKAASKPAKSATSAKSAQAAAKPAAGSRRSTPARTSGAGRRVQA